MELSRVGVSVPVFSVGESFGLSCVECRDSSCDQHQQEHPERLFCQPEDCGQVTQAHESRVCVSHARCVCAGGSRAGGGCRARLAAAAPSFHRQLTAGSELNKSELQAINNRLSGLLQQDKFHG